MKLSLGTAQFGGNYGIKGGVKVKEQEVQRILDVCSRNGLETIDTASLYGDSERVLGRCNLEGFDVVTKVPSIAQESRPDEMLDFYLTNSLDRLSIEKLDGLLLHSSDDLLSRNGEAIFHALEKVKPRRTKKIGVSIYCPKILERILDYYPVDFVQIPYNPIDPRWDDLILTMSKLGVEIHVRSIFLQGLLLMQKAELPNYFKRWRDELERWFDWVDASNDSALGKCLNYVYQNKLVDKIVVGVDSSQQLTDIVGLLDPVKRVSIPKELQIDDPALLNPANWRLD